MTFHQCFFSFHIRVNSKKFKSARLWRCRVSIGAGVDKNPSLPFNLGNNVNCTFWTPETKARCWYNSRLVRKEKQRVILGSCAFCSEGNALAMLTWSLSSGMMLLKC